jgi:hypothetical protein
MLIWASVSPAERRHNDNQLGLERFAGKPELTRPSLFNQIYATGQLLDGTSASTAQAIIGGWSYNRNLSPRLFVNLFNNYEYDKFQDLDLRFVIGGGLGYSVIKNERTRLDLLGGADYNHEKYSTPLSRNSAELSFGDVLTHKISKAIPHWARIFPNMSDLGQYRINFELVP